MEYFVFNGGKNNENQEKNKQNDDDDDREKLRTSASFANRPYTMFASVSAVLWR